MRQAGAMDLDYWRNRWQQGNIAGFHLGDANPHLVAHQEVLPAAPARVFVPLCGKSVDLLWLAQQGYEVTGVELSPLALDAFFRERGISPRVSTAAGFTVYRVPQITLFCGDFFALTPALLGPVDGAYDRAALMALPPAMRARYAAHMASLLGAHARALLVCFDYDQTKMAGPPFAVSEVEVRTLYGDNFTVTLRASHDVLEGEPRFRNAGLTALHEHVYSLERSTPA